MAAANRPLGKPLVLVPGACLGGWAWRDVAALTRRLGHDTYPVTLTGLGERVHLGTPETDLETHIADVVGVLDYEALTDAVLVGHSYAGIVVTGVADRRPERLNAVVYLDTSPLPTGHALADIQPPEARERQKREADEGGDGWRWPVPDRATLESGAYGTADDLADSHFRLLEERATPHPYRTFTQPLVLEHDAPPDVRRAAIFGAHGGIDVATIRRLIDEGDPRAAMFAGPDWELHDLDTGHWAMFSAPGPLADLLHRIAA